MVCGTQGQGHISQGATILDDIDHVVSFSGMSWHIVPFGVSWGLLGAVLCQFGFNIAI